jgi:hypothetical protein
VFSCATIDVIFFFFSSLSHFVRDLERAKNILRELKKT